jgi:hypothetical protein
MRPEPRSKPASNQVVGGPDSSGIKITSPKAAVGDFSFQVLLEASIAR